MTHIAQQEFEFYQTKSELFDSYLWLEAYIIRDRIYIAKFTTLRYVFDLVYKEEATILKEIFRENTVNDLEMECLLRLLQKYTFKVEWLKPVPEVESSGLDMSHLCAEPKLILAADMPPNWLTKMRTLKTA